MAAHLRRVIEADINQEYLTDSKTGFYVFDKSTKRTPMQYHTQRLVDPTTGKNYDKPPLLKNSNETIHKSVRVRFWKTKTLLKDGQEYEPFALKGDRTPGTRDPYSWLYTKGGNVGPLPEAPFIDSERAILKLWSNNSANHLENFDLDEATH